ncbi:MAG: hypothetical protein B7Z37_19365 [Verrucomicrobia bacterium 12-59-8]|nr:MAG: hypothetical protein B7Z37_19365 [Verrucomicrobia bacterium 12-59-8]
MLTAMKITRILVVLFGFGLLLAVAAPLGGVWWLRQYVNKERLTLETEKNINARVHLDDVTLSIFSWPPTLRLSGIKIGPRDQYAGAPIAARPPMQNAEVQVEMAYLELVPQGLWQRQFLPRILRLIGVEVNETISPQEGSSLQKLFQPPPEKLAQMQEEVPHAIPLPSAPPVAAVPAPGEPAPAMTTPPVTAPAEPQSNAQRLSLQEISIEQAHFHITNQGVDSQFNADISDFSLALTEIDIDPDDLMAHNHLHVRLAAKVVVDGVTQVGGQKRQVRFADMTLHGDGEVNPVDPATRMWSPAADLNLTIDRGSSIGGNMTIGETAGPHLEKLMKYGIDLSAIRIGGTFAQDVHAHILYREQSMRFLDDTQFVLPDYEYTIKRDSWMDFAKDQQGLLTRLSCGDALKQSLMQGIASRGINRTLSQLVVEGLSDSRGRLTFDLTVTGSLSHPEVKPDLQVKLENLLGNDIEEKAKGLINTFKGLKGLFK